MENIIQQDKEYILNLYKRNNIILTEAKGSYIYDSHGNKYLDMFSGLSVNNFGHNDREIISRIIEQSTKYIHLSNNFVSEPVVNLAKVLVNNTFASKVFFTNSGTESIEAAIKLAKKFGKSSSKSKYQLLSAHNSFHGRTCGGLSLTGQKKYQKNFYPLLPGIEHFKFNDIQDLKSKVSNDTCAVFIEIIQGSGGIREVTQDFIYELINLSKQFNFLIVVDEVQTSLGRTGDFLAFEKYEFIPDLVCLAKSLGGGLPLGAMLVSKELENVLVIGDHGSTCGGNPVACSIGEYIVETVNDFTFRSRIKEKSKYLFAKLRVLKEKYFKIINEIRGRGLMIGVDTEDYASLIKDLALKRGLLLNVTCETVVRLLPPLTISIEEIDEFLDIFENILRDISKGQH